MAGLQQQRTHERDILEYQGREVVFPRGQATNDEWMCVCPERGQVEGIGEGLRRL